MSNFNSSDRPSTKQLTSHEVFTGIAVKGMVSYKLAEPFGHLREGEVIIITRSWDKEDKPCLIYGRVWQDPEGQFLAFEDIETIPVLEEV